MAKKLLKPAAFLLLLLAAHSVLAQPAKTSRESARVKIPLHSGWTFREAGKGDWHKAAVPGCVHTDLLANKLIEDPFYRDDEPKL
ncbi:MAG: hypothetical protein DMF66_17340, partial [Acidobacteria bacterium]